MYSASASAESECMRTPGLDQELYSSRTSPNSARRRSLQLPFAHCLEKPNLGKKRNELGTHVWAACLRSAFPTSDQLPMRNSQGQIELVEELVFFTISLPRKYFTSLRGQKLQQCNQGLNNPTTTELGRNSPCLHTFMCEQVYTVGGRSRVGFTTRGGGRVACHSQTVVSAGVTGVYAAPCCFQRDGDGRFQPSEQHQRDLGGPTF
jgi:hypothetical protein